jgi:peptidoglycan/LPS O-acetylase OafA/YrhL
MSQGAARSQVYDAARGLGVMAVMAYHAVGFLVADRQPDEPLDLEWWIFGIGTLGVDMFFVLSGFLLVGSWRAVRRSHPGRWGAVREYTRRRARRILPAYWVSLAVLVPLTAPTLLQSADGLKRLALLGSVQQYLDRQLPGEVNRVYWSLTTEVHFYVLLPVLAYLLFRFRGRALLPLCLAASVAWRLWKPEDAAESLIFGRIDQFVAGMAAAGLVVAFDAGRPGRLMRWLLTRHALWVIVGVIVAAGFYQGGSHLSRTGPMTGFEFVHPIAGLAFAGLFARVTCRARSPRRLAAPLAAVGVISYSLYLWHIPIVEGGMDFTGLDEPGTHPLLMLFALAVFFAVAAAVSVVSFRWVEAPFLDRRVPQEPEVKIPSEPAVPVRAWDDATTPLAPTGAR